MNTFVIDASIAIKWVVEDDGTHAALALYQRDKLIAPELLVPECAKHSLGEGAAERVVERGSPARGKLTPTR